VEEDLRQEEVVAEKMAATVAEEEAEGEEVEVIVSMETVPLMQDRELVSTEPTNKEKMSLIQIKNKEADSKANLEILIHSTDNLELEEARENQETRKVVLEEEIGEIDLTRSTSKLARLKRAFQKVPLNPSLLLSRKKDRRRSRKKKWKWRRLKKSFLESALTTS
jgi:hypothetical protein